MPKKNDLNSIIGEPLQYYRASTAKGLEESDAPRVERDGGKYGAGIIRGASVITRGEALGHYMWVDAEMLDQVADAMKQLGETKARFTHPGLSSDGLGTLTGRFANPRKSEDGERVFADLHLMQSAKNTPDGDLNSYILDLAEESPEDFGISIVFMRDFDAEYDFEADHREETEHGKVFVSPDPDNIDNLPHARLYRMKAADIVDEPAANPDGLFRRGPDLTEVESLLSYSLGISTEVPEMSQLDIEPRRVAGFVQKFLSQHGLQITQEKDPGMTKSKTLKAKDKGLSATPAPETPETETPAADSAPDKSGDDKSGTDESGEDKSGTDDSGTETPSGETQQASGEKSVSLGEMKRWGEAFGDNAISWLSEGISYEQGLERLNAIQAEEIRKLKLANSAHRGEEEPLSASQAEGADTKTGSKLSDRKINLGDRLGSFAEGIDAKLAAKN